MQGVAQWWLAIWRTRVNGTAAMFSHRTGYMK